MSRIKAIVTASVMRWAREQAKLSLQEASDKIKRPVEDIQGWEDGSVRPSIAQARKASKVYRRPLAVFYLPEPPKDFETLRDFRTLPDTEQREYSPELALIMRTTHYRQEWMHDYLAAEGLAPLAFVGSAKLSDSPSDVAQAILKAIELTPKKQMKCKTRYDALRLWLDKIEAAGVFVFRQRQIELEEARGFVMSDDYAPFVFINSGDSQAGQLFTLAHELAHLWLGQSGVSNLEPVGRALDAETKEIERFCNKVAAEAIMEESLFNRQWRQQSSNLPLEERILKISNAFKVSEEMVARRLLEKGVIDRDRYLELRQRYQERWVEYESRARERMRSSGRGPSYYVTTLAKNGYSFTQTVVSAFISGEVSGRDASSLLDVKVNNIYRLGETAGIIHGTRESANG